MKKYKSFDDWLNIAKSEADNISAPNYLRQNIRDDFEKRVQKDSLWRKFFDYITYTPRLQFGLISLFLIGLIGLVLINQRTPQLITDKQAEYLASELNDEVYESQQAYERAIANLEKQLQKKYGDTTDELTLLYLERIKAIDELILVCKSSLLENPYSPTIHRAMFAAYSEKVETINTLLDIN